MKLNTSLRFLSITISIFIINGCESLSFEEPGDLQFTETPQVHRSEFNDIYFVSNKTRSYQLYSMREDGSHIIQLTNDPTFEITDGSLSPDGKRIVANTPSGEIIPYGPAMYVMNLDGTEKRLLITPGKSNNFNNSGINPVWSKSGRYIAFTRKLAPEFAGIFHSFVIESNGTNEKDISTHDLPEFPNDWDRHGNLVLASIEAASRDTLGRTTRYTRIGLIDFNGDYKWLWGDSSYNCYYPVYSRDGRSIVYTSNKLGSTDLFINVNSGEEDYRLTDEGNYVVYRAMAWSGDDSRILVNARRAESQNNGLYGSIAIVSVRHHSMVDITPFGSDSSYSYAIGWRVSSFRDRIQR